MIVCLQTIAETLPVTTFDDLPCPSKDEYRRLIVEVKFIGPLEGEHCGDGSPKERFGKLLKFIKEMKVGPLTNWKAGADEALENPFKYIKKMSSSIHLDKVMTKAVAYNRQKKIYLGLRFFNSSPIDGLVTLIHESRHSDYKARRHIKCKFGDMAQYVGACDNKFEVGKKAGGYAFQVSFMLGLARFGKNLTRGDKAELIEHATSYFTNRFNFISNGLGKASETLVVLDDLGQLYLYHPIIKKLLPIPTDGIDGKIIKIKLNQTSIGTRFGRDIFVFTNLGNVYHYFPGRPIKRIKPHYLPPSSEVLDIRMVNNKTIFLTHFSSYWKLVINKHTKKFHARKLSSDLSKHFNTTPGLFYKKLFDINDEGKLLFLVRGNKRKARPVFVPTKFKVVKYQEGITANYLLDDQGEQFIWSNIDIQSIRIKHFNPQRKIIDFAVSRSIIPDKLFFQITSQNLEQFAKRCLIDNPQLDPWTGGSMGLDVNGDLVFEWQSSCHKFQLPGNIKIKSFKFINQKRRYQRIFSRVQLSLSTQPLK